MKQKCCPDQLDYEKMEDGEKIQMDGEKTKVDPNTVAYGTLKDDTE